MLTASCRSNTDGFAFCVSPEMREGDVGVCVRMGAKKPLVASSQSQGSRPLPLPHRIHLLWWQKPCSFGEPKDKQFRPYHWAKGDGRFIRQILKGPEGWMEYWYESELRALT